MSPNPLVSVVSFLGGYEASGRICGRTGKAVWKWCKQGRLPRTEWTGETDYAAKLVAASNGYVTRDQLLDRVPVGTTCAPEFTVAQVSAHPSIALIDPSHD